MTALQAIASAGGFQDDASKGSVVVMRRTGPSSLITRKIDLHDAVQRGASSQDVYLRRYDIVYVNRNAIGDVNLFVDRFFRKMVPVFDLYIRGWQAFNMERVFPSTERLIIETTQ
jgi:protein involved in polysaccharide export with SLBB domain